MSPSTPLQTVSEIFGGFGKGIVGVFTKPIGGAAELISQAGYGNYYFFKKIILKLRKYNLKNMKLGLLI